MYGVQTWMAHSLSSKVREQRAAVASRRNPYSMPERLRPCASEARSPPAMRCVYCSGAYRKRSDWLQLLNLAASSCLLLALPLQSATVKAKPAPADPTVSLVPHPFRHSNPLINTQGRDPASDIPLSVSASCPTC